MSAVREVWFKHEDELDGEPIGPMQLVFDDDDPYALKPYDPNKPRDPWVKRSHALQAAEMAGVSLKEL